MTDTGPDEQPVEPTLTDRLHTAEYVLRTREARYAAALKDRWDSSPGCVFRLHTESAGDLAGAAMAMADAEQADLRAQLDRAEAERDTLGREADRLRRDWEQMRQRAARLAAARTRLAADLDRTRAAAADARDEHARLALAGIAAGLHDALATLDSPGPDDTEPSRRHAVEHRDAESGRHGLQRAAEETLNRVRAALTERRTEVAEYEAENPTSAWSDAVTVTCDRIEDACRPRPKPGAIPDPDPTPDAER